MAEIVTLSEAVEGARPRRGHVALEGFTHLIPNAAGHELIRQGRRDLTLVRMTPDVIYDQLIGMGCARKLVFSWGGNPGVGSLHRLRDAVEHGWPRAARARGALARRHGGGLRGRRGEPAVRRPARLPRHRPAGAARASRAIDCPFTGEELAAVPAHRPDVGIVHAQQADRHGQRPALGDHRRAEGGGARVGALDRHRRGDRRRARAAAGRASSCRRWVDRRGRASCPAARTRRTRTATTTATTTFYVAWDAISRDRDAFTRVDATSTSLDGGGRARRDRYTPDEMMAVEAARRLARRHRLLRRHRPAEPRREPRAPHARAGLRARLRERHDRREADALPLSIGDGELAETADAVVSVPEMFALLAPGRPHRRRLPRRRADRPARQPEQHRDRRLRRRRRCACRAAAARPRSRRGVRDVFVMLRQTRARVRRAARLHDEPRRPRARRRHRPRRARAARRRADARRASTPASTVDDARAATGWELRVADDLRETDAADATTSWPRCARCRPRRRHERSTRRSSSRTTRASARTSRSTTRATARRAARADAAARHAARGVPRARRAGLRRGRARARSTTTSPASTTASRSASGSSSPAACSTRTAGRSAARSSRSGRRTPPAATAHEVDQHPAPLDPNFSGAGRCLTDADGRYRFVTIKPGRVSVGQPRRTRGGRRTSTSRVFGRAFAQRLVTQMYFPGDPLFAYDPIFHVGARPEGARAAGRAASTSRRPSPSGRSATAGTSCSARGGARRRRSEDA